MIERADAQTQAPAREIRVAFLVRQWPDHGHPARIEERISGEGGARRLQVQGRKLELRSGTETDVAQLLGLQVTPDIVRAADGELLVADDGLDRVLPAEIRDGNESMPGRGPVARPGAQVKV